MTGLQTTIMKRAGDTGFIVTCSAAGKPKPIVSWFKDGVEISAGESEIYQISTSEQVTFFSNLILYKVSHLLVDLGWVDFDFGAPPSCPAAGIFPPAQAESADSGTLKI